jgi:hypothetical protein
MSEGSAFEGGGIYQIKVKGHLDSSWSTWFEEMSLACEEGAVTRLTGYMPDQPALYGLIIKIRDLGLTLISVNRLPPVGQATAGHSDGS